MDAMEKPVRRCENCDRETDKYVVNLSPGNEEHILCWMCKERGEKGQLRISNYELRIKEHIPKFEI